MEFIQKLPFITGASMSLISGIISLKFEYSKQDVYLIMLITLLVFYILGCYARKIVLKIQDEIDEKNRLEEVRKKEELESQKMLEMEEMKEKKEKHDKGKKNSTTGQSIDFKADEDEFSPLTVSEVIVNKMNE